MALDPRLLTPAAIKSAMMQQQTPFLQERVIQSMRPPMGLDQLIQGSQPKPQTPQLGPTIGNAALMSAGELTTTPQDDATAKAIGSQAFGNMDLSGVTDSSIESMATDNPEEVDDEAKAVYEGNQSLAQILGAITKIQNSTKSSELFKKLIDEEIDPDTARKEVNEFFGKSAEEQTPVWADVAVSIGLSLLRGEGAKTTGDSPLGGFLKDIGIAGERGFAVAKARAKEKRARSDTLNKLAFGIWREDEKQRKTLGVQLAKQLGDERKEQQKLILDLGKFYQDQEKIDNKVATDRASAISSALNVLTTDQKEKALPIIARFPNAFKGVPPDQVQATMFGLLKSNGLQLENVSDASNILESSFVISTQPEFDRYKELFPQQFEGLEFQDGKLYTVEGFADKSKVTDPNRGLVGILGVKPSIGAQDELARLFQQKNSLQQTIQGMGTDSPEYAGIKEQLDAVTGRIDLLSTRKTPQSYVFADGQMVAAGEGAAGAFAASDAVQKANELSKQGNSLASAFGLADGLMRSLSTGEAPSDATGVIAKAGRGIQGLRGQVDAFVNTFGANKSDNESNYLNGNITQTMLSNNERVGNTTVGKVFSQLQKLAKGNAEIQSQLMSFAYALAGSRETGKLTDKDVAAALVTFGGGDIADGKWFASGDVLVTGINQALTTATNDYAIRYNKVHSAPGNLKYLRDVESLDENEIADRTKFDLNKFLKTNEGIREGLSDRIIYDPRGANGQIIRMQSLDKYRGEGAGNVGGEPQYSQAQLTDFAVIDRLAQLYANDANALKAALDRIDDATLRAYREYKRSQQ